MTRQDMMQAQDTLDELHNDLRAAKSPEERAAIFEDMGHMRSRLARGPSPSFVEAEE